MTTAPANVGKKKEKKIESVLKRVVFCVCFFFLRRNKGRRVDKCSFAILHGQTASTRLLACGCARVRAYSPRTVISFFFFFMSFFPSVASDDIMKLRKKRD